MSVRDVLRAERARLCDTLERYGPDAPTLCVGWTTADLAAHLVVRERDPRSGPGLVLGGRAAAYTNRLRLRTKAKGYPWLLDRLRAGPPAFVLLTMAGLNVNENWIHHEDVRRANGESPRPADPEVDGVLLGSLLRLGKFQLRALKRYSVEIVLPDGLRHVLRKGGTTVTLHGPVGEIVLYLSGRRDAARTELTGDPAAIEALRTAKLGV
jgi:uncharacterized protein (TIGR03085 family)